MNKDYQICVNCVMDTSDPEIHFDNDGVCNYCRDYFDKRKHFILDKNEKEFALNKIIQFCKKQGKRKKYDCIIGVSGGVDSTYTAYLVKKFGLRPLAIHLDNGWNTELAVSNIHNVLKKLDIELYTYVLDWEMFRSLQVAFLKASVPDLEIPTDHAIVALLRRIAAQYDVPIIWGVNYTTEFVLPKAWSQGHMNWEYIKKINNLFGSQKLKGYPHYTVFYLIYLNRIKKQQIFSILDLVDYNKESAKKFLISEFGWKDYGDKHHESIYTKFIQSYILPIKFGFDKRRAHISSLILAGQLSRQQALEILKRPPYDEKEIKEQLYLVLKKLGLTDKEFSNIMNMPPRKYENFAPKWPQKVRFIEKKIFNKVKNFSIKLGIKK